MKTDIDAEWVADCADYLRQKIESDAKHEKASDDEKLIRAKLDRAARHMDALIGELQSLRRDMRIGRRWHAFREALPPLTRALAQIGPALGPLSDATLMVKRDPATRALRYQKMAVRLAHARTEPDRKRSTRSLAIRIMHAAGVAQPESDKSITNWLRDIRAEGSASEL